jgi:hypothetical protein
MGRKRVKYQHSAQIIRKNIHSCYRIQQKQSLGQQVQLDARILFLPEQIKKVVKESFLYIYFKFGNNKFSHIIHNMYMKKSNWSYSEGFLSDAVPEYFCRQTYWKEPFQQHKTK